MQENPHTYTPSELQFSSSKLYFQHQNQILQKIGFISPMSIDINFKYTFQEVKPNYFIEGGEFEGLTVDHEAHEQGIIYKIGFLNPKFKNIENFSLDMKKNYLDNPSIRPLVRGLLGWLLVFILLAWLGSKFQFGQVLLLINVFGALILLTFYGIKIGKTLFKKMNSQTMKYGGFTASYAKESDTSIASPEMIEMLNVLEKEFWITKFCCTGNCIYLLQDVHDHNGERLNSTSKLYSEQEKAILQQKTMQYLNTSDFLSNFL